jgi:hypothetical protein
VITDLLIKLFFTVPNWFVDALDSVPLPDPGSIVDPITSDMTTVTADASEMGNWIPWDAVVACVGLVVAGVVAAVLVRVIRIVASFLTLGGGS